MANVTFTVDNSGDITGDNRANVGDTLIVNNAPGANYTGAIYAVRPSKHHPDKTINYTSQLVGNGTNSLSVATSYTIVASARGHSFIITTTAPDKDMTVGAPLAGTNGTLHVGSGGDDDDDDARRGGSGNP